jgi:hypothetical protein
MQVVENCEAMIGVGRGRQGGVFFPKTQCFCCFCRMFGDIYIFILYSFILWYVVSCLLAVCWLFDTLLVSLIFVFDVNAYFLYSSD